MKWWVRWWVRQFPLLAMKRLRYCRKEHRGPMYDGIFCLTCGAAYNFRRKRYTWFTDGDS